MPRLPTFEELGTARPQPAGGVVGYQPTSGAETAPGESMAAEGQKIEAESTHLYRAIKWQQHLTDTTKTEDAWNKYKNSALDLTVGDNGLLNTLGADAVNGNLMQRAQSTLEAQRKAISQTLDNDEQRRRFDERAQVTDMQVKHQVLTHLTAQQRDYDKTVMMGSEGAANAQIAAMPTDPGVFAQARETVMAQADTYLKSRGVTDQGAIDAYKDKINDGLWNTRIDKLLYSNPVLAEAVFRANQDKIKNPELRLQLQARTREMGIGVSATMEADKAIATATQDAAKVGIKSLEPGSRERQLAELDAAIKARPDDPDLREARYAVEQYGIEPSTNGLPNSKDLRALLPIALGKVDKRADEIYGPDKSNPDRVAFVKRMNSEIVSKISLNVQQMEAIQNQQLGILVDYINGVQTGGVPSGAGTAGATKVAGVSPAGMQKVTSFSQIQASPDMARAYQLLDYRGKLAVDQMIEKNQRASDIGDPAYARQLLQKIWQDPGTPGKIDYPSQIYTPENIQRLSTAELNHLAAQARTQTTAGGRSAQQMQAYAEKRVDQFFKTNVMFTAQPERQIAATMKWNESAGKKIDEYVKAGKDVRTLFMSDTPDSIVSPQYLQSYVNSTPAQGLAEQAAAVKAGAPAAPPPIAQPATIKTREALDAWFKTLPPEQTTFTGTDGKVRLIPKRQQAAAGPVQATQQPAAAPATGVVPAPGMITMDDTGKLVQAPPANPQDAGYGNRADGTPKGKGFLGPLPRPDGKVSTEITVGVNLDGKEMQIPTLVPTLTLPEINKLLALKEGEQPPDDIVKKAVAYARKRIAAGKPVFATPEESAKAIELRNRVKPR